MPRRPMIVDVTRSDWPEGVTDGLDLPCHDCDRKVAVGFIADSDDWLRVVPGPERRSVLCLECFVVRGGDVTKVSEIQVVGDGCTVLFRPTVAYRYPAPATTSSTGLPPVDKG